MLSICIMDTTNIYNDTYFNVLQYFLPKYRSELDYNTNNMNNVNDTNINREFISEKDIIITGIFHYIPYNLSAVYEFKNFISNM